jgi:hypothetical protein
MQIQKPPNMWMKAKLNRQGNLNFDKVCQPAHLQSVGEICIRIAMKE